MTLLIGTLLGLVGSGQYTVPLATWAVSVFLLRFVRDHPIRVGIPALITATMPTLILGWSFFPFGGTVGLVVFAIVASTMGALPYLLDRLLAPEEHGWSRLLTFPIVAAGMEWSSQHGNDLGSWGASAYTQVDQHGLLQLVSVTGLVGPTFVMALFATVVNDVWESSRRSRAPSTTALAGALLIAATLMLGQARRVRTPPLEPVRVAGISGPRWNALPPELFASWREAEVLSAADLDRIRRHTAPEHARLWDAVEREARAGAELITWSEAAMVLPDVDREPVLERGAELARTLDVTLVLALGVLDTGPAPRRLENQTVIVTPDGRISKPYLKTIPTPGAEREFTRAGDGRLVVVDTPVGRVATVICYDADFPGLVAKAGAAEADVLVVPAGDWAEVAALHADMASVRAVEQGLSVLRVASAGRSTAVDPYGRVVAAHRWSPRGPDTLAGVLPVGRIPTAYSTLGDLFGGTLALLTLLGIVGRTARWLRDRR